MWKAERKKLNGKGKKKKKKSTVNLRNEPIAHTLVKKRSVFFFFFFQILCRKSDKGAWAGKCKRKNKHRNFLKRAKCVFFMSMY